MLPFALSKSRPMPFSAAMKSPTIAPTTARVIATFMPPKIAGKAFGSRTRQKSCSGVAPAARATYSLPGSVDESPTIVSTTIGKNATRNTISAFDVSPKPNQSRNSGASATFGTTCEPISSG